MKKMSLIRLELGFIVFISLFALSLFASLYGIGYIYPGYDYMKSFYRLAPYLLSIKGIALIPFMFYIAKDYAFYKYLFMVVTLNGIAGVYLGYEGTSSVYQIISFNLMFDIIFIPIVGALMFGDKKESKKYKSKNTQIHDVAEIPEYDKVNVLSRESEKMLEKIKTIPDENKPLYESLVNLTQEKQTSATEAELMKKTESQPEIEPLRESSPKTEPPKKLEDEPESAPEPEKVLAVLKNENLKEHEKMKDLFPEADVFCLNGENVQDDSRFTGDKDFLEYVVGVEKYDRVVVDPQNISREEFLEFFKTISKASCPLEIMDNKKMLKKIKNIRDLFEAFPINVGNLKAREWKKIVAVNSNPLTDSMLKLISGEDYKEIHLVNCDKSDDTIAGKNIYRHNAKNDEDWEQVPLDGTDMVLYSYELENINACETFPDMAIETNLFSLVDFLEMTRQKDIGEIVFLSSLTAYECNSVQGAVYKNGEAIVEAFGKYSKTISKNVRVGWYINKDSKNILRLEDKEHSNLRLEPEEALPFAYEVKEIAEILLDWISRDSHAGTYYLNTGKQIYLPYLVDQLHCREHGGLDQKDLVNLKYHIDKYMVDYPKDKDTYAPVFEKEEAVGVDYMIARKIVDNLRTKLEEGKVSDAKKYLNQLAEKYRGI